MSWFTRPPSTISTTSSVSSSVTRMPWMKSDLLADFLQQAGDLRPAAMHDDRVHAHQFQQHHVLGEGLHQMPLGHGVAAILDDDGLVVETLDVRQRLGQDIGLVGGGWETVMADSGIEIGADFTPIKKAARSRLFSA